MTFVAPGIAEWSSAIQKTGYLTNNGNTKTERRIIKKKDTRKKMVILKQNGELPEDKKF